MKTLTQLIKKVPDNRYVSCNQCPNDSKSETVIEFSTYYPKTYLCKPCLLKALTIASIDNHDPYSFMHKFDAIKGVL